MFLDDDADPKAHWVLKTFDEDAAKTIQTERTGFYLANLKSGSTLGIGSVMERNGRMHSESDTMFSTAT